MIAYSDFVPEQSEGPMHSRFGRSAPVHAVLIGALLLFASHAAAQNTTPSYKEATVTQTASGPFDVEVTRQDDNSDDPLLNRMVLDKKYHGDLDATGHGQMLTAGTAVKGSGAYVAIEKVSGTLKGHKGTFILQHTGTMTQNKPKLTIVVVPDSGTGDLAGLSGKMKINIAADGKHSYELEYTLNADE